MHRSQQVQPCVAAPHRHAIPAESGVQRLQPVSYTHLDVYKRQLPHMGSTDFLLLRALFFQHAGQHAEVKHRAHQEDEQN